MRGLIQQRLDLALQLRVVPTRLFETRCAQRLGALQHLVEDPLDDGPSTARHGSLFILRGAIVTRSLGKRNTTTAEFNRVGTIETARRLRVMKAGTEGREESPARRRRGRSRQLNSSRAVSVPLVP